MKIPTINIYIKEKHKEELKKYCAKHHVSFSTFLSCLAYATYKIQKELSSIYLTDKGSKTSVKVSCNWTSNLTTNEKAILYTNLIYVYFSKKLNGYYNPKEYQRIKNLFQKNIDKSTDEYYDYNRHIRSTTRMLKNREMRTYLKKEIENHERQHN